MLGIPAAKLEMWGFCALLPEVPWLLAGVTPFVLDFLEMICQSSSLRKLPPSREVGAGKDQCLNIELGREGTRGQRGSGRKLWHLTLYLY